MADRWPPCSKCGAPPVVLVNDVSYCLDHLDDGFAVATAALRALYEEDPHGQPH